MNYRKTFQVEDAKGALAQLTKKLKEIGFKTRDGNDQFVKMVGPRFVSTKTSPLTAIKRLEIRANGRDLRITAQGNKAVMLFVYILAAVFVPMFVSAPFVPNNAMWLVLAINLGVWALILPLIALLFRAKAADAMDALVESL